MLLPDPTDIQSATDAAVQAAGAGDFAAAERFLRRAVELQERALGAGHPDVANTLNNLGVVYERLEQPDRAEECYRRAYLTASAALRPDHPFVEMSAKNLREFCAARGIPFTNIRSDAASVATAAAPVPTAAAPALSPATPPAPVVAPAQPAAARPVAQPTVFPSSRPVQQQASPAAPAPAARTRPTSVPPPPAVTSSRSSGIPGQAFAIAGLIAGAVVIAWLAIARPWLPARTATTEPQAPPASSPADPAAAEHASPPADTAEPSSSATARTPPSTPAGRPEDAAPRATSASRDATSSRGAAAPTALDVRLCRTLVPSGAWRCGAVDGPLSTGAVFFYTRLAAPTATTVEHRWYHDGRLHQTVTLRVAANPAGYRTYSRMTVNSGRAGAWRVEARAADGTVLGTRQFTVVR